MNFVERQIHTRPEHGTPSMAARTLDRATNALASVSGLPQGPDLNQYRVPDDFGAVAATDFVIWKDTQADWKDAYADYMAEESYKASDVRGSYFYDDLNKSKEENVDYYIEVAQTRDLDMVIGDWEPYNRNRDVRHRLTADRVIWQLERLEAAFPDKLILAYMNLDVLKNYMAYDVQLKRYKLWLSYPYGTTAPKLKNGFEVFMWQRSWTWPRFKNKVHALDSVDWNEVQMSRAEFRQLVKPDIGVPDDPPIDIDFDKIWEHIGNGTQELNAGIKLMEETAVKLTEKQIELQEGENG